MPISDFPNEIFRTIFDYLSVSDVCNCSLVCKSWSSLVVPSKWRQVRFRVVPWNTKLASLLRQRPTNLENFRFTNHLAIDLGYSRRAFTWIDWESKSIELLHRIIANLPVRFHMLEVIFHCSTLVDTRISSILCLLLPLARQAIHGVRFVFLGSQYTFLSSEDFQELVPFFPMLTELTTNTSLLLNVQFSPMPRLTYCEIDGEGSRIENMMDVFRHSPLETLSLSEMYIPESIDLPHTITSLSLIDVHGSTLLLAFFQFPNLRNLVLHFRKTKYIYNPLGGVRPGQPIVSTELYAYASSVALPLWLSERIGESCRNLSSIHFKGVLAKYSHDFSPLLSHFRERRRTSIISEHAKSSWEALFWGKGGSHFIFFDETFRKDRMWESEWQLRRSLQPPATPGDIVGLQVVKNEGIYMTTFNEEEQKEFDSSGFWTGSSTQIETSNNADFWELIRIDGCKP
jgi:F-box-like